MTFVERHFFDGGHSGAVVMRSKETEAIPDVFQSVLSPALNNLNPPSQRHKALHSLCYNAALIEMLFRHKSPPKQLI